MEQPHELGYETNTDSPFSFFVQGVGRFTDKNIFNIADRMLDNPFFDADDLWENFQENLNSFVSNHSGSLILITS